MFVSIIIIKYSKKIFIIKLKSYGIDQGHIFFLWTSIRSFSTTLKLFCLVSNWTCVRRIPELSLNSLIWEYVWNTLNLCFSAYEIYSIVQQSIITYVEEKYKTKDNSFKCGKVMWWIHIHVYDIVGMHGERWGLSKQKQWFQTIASVSRRICS